MLSGFITQDGFVELTDEEMGNLNAERAAEGLPPISMFYRASAEELGTDKEEGVAKNVSYYLFEYGKGREGWWDSDKMIAHTKDVIAMLKIRYPGKKFIFLFDWSSGHDKKPVDSAILSKMNKDYGGKQPAMRSVVILEDYNSPTPAARALKKNDVQHLVFQPGDAPPFYKLGATDYVGKPKGLRQVAYELGLYRPHMVKRNDEDPELSLFHVLSQCADFQGFVKSQLQEDIEALGHGCDFLPKFHCELSAVERVWAKSKRFTRDNSDDTRVTLLANIPKSLGPTNVSVLEVQNYFGRSRRYAECYQRGDSILLAEAAVKKKSHRTVRASEAFQLLK